MDTTHFYPPLAYQSVFDDSHDAVSPKATPRKIKGGQTGMTTPSKATRFASATTPMKIHSPTFRKAGDGPYPSISTASSNSNSSLGSTSVASSVMSATPSRTAVSPNVTKKKQKLFAPSPASIAMLNPAHAMGIDVDDDVYVYHQTQDSESSSMIPGAGSYDSLVSPVSDSRSASPYQSQRSNTADGESYSSTPELAAFALTDLQSALTGGQSPAPRYPDSQVAQAAQTYADYDDVSYGRPAPASAVLQQSRRRANTMASVFEDDDGHASPKTTSPARKVAFLIKNAPSEGLAKGGRGMQGQSSSANKSIARFFGWKKGSSKSKGFNDEDEPASAPAHVTSFDRSGTMASPLKEASPSLPTTPVGQHVALSGDPSILPHRKNAPVPKSILRKQSAPALREHSRPWTDASAVPPMPRPAEAPGSLGSAGPSTNSWDTNKFQGGSPPRMQQGGRRRDPPTPLRVPPSRSTSSDLSRGYSGVGRGVARRSSDASSIMVGSPIKSPRRKQVPTRLDAATMAPASRAMYNTASTHHISKISRLGDLASQHTLYAIEDAAEDELDVMQNRRRSMAQRVVDGVNSYAFEEPAPRITALVGPEPHESDRPGLVPAAKANRRRSRSVGANVVPDPFASAFAAFNSVHSLSTPSSTDSAGSAALASRIVPSTSLITHTPTQKDVPTFESSSSNGTQRQYVPLSLEERRAGDSFHKPTDSGNSSASSNSDDLSLSHAATVVATRRVQQVARATPLSSPSLKGVRMAGSSSSNVGSPRLMATPATKRQQQYQHGPMVTILPPTPDMPGTGAFSSAKNHFSSPLSSPLKSADAAEETLRRTWSERNSCLYALKAATLNLPPEEIIEEETEEECVIRQGLYQVNDMRDHNEDDGDDDDDDSVPGSLPYDFPAVPAVAPLNIKRKDSNVEASPVSESSETLSEHSSNERGSAAVREKKTATTARIPPSFSNESIMSGLDELDWHPLSYSETQAVLPSITTSANLEYTARMAAKEQSRPPPAVPAIPSKHLLRKRLSDEADLNHEQMEQTTYPHMTQLPTHVRLQPFSQDSTGTHPDSLTASDFSNGSMPSLDSAYTSASSNRPLLSELPSEGNVDASVSQSTMFSAGAMNSLNDIDTTGPNNLYQDTPNDQVQRYVHRAQLSHDAFSQPRDRSQELSMDHQNSSVQPAEDRTPRISDSPWSQMRQQERHAVSPPRSPAFPTIKVSDTSLSLSGSASASPQLGASDQTLGGSGSHGLSMLGPYEGKIVAPRVSSRKTGSRSPSPALSASARSLGARSVTPTQRSPVSDASRSSSASTPYGLGLDLGVGQIKSSMASATQVEYTPTRILVKDSRAQTGNGTWEEQQQQQYFHDAQARARRPRVALQAQAQEKQASPTAYKYEQQQQYRSYSPHFPQEQLFQPQGREDWQQRQPQQHYLRPASADRTSGYESLRESGEWEMGVAL